MSDEIERAVLNMLAEERGLRLDKLTPSSRLREDLGMDGDDAVDFFTDIKDRFDTDLTALQTNWSNHFGPEGISCSFALLILPPAVAAGLIVAALGWPKTALIPVMVVLVGGIVWFTRRRPLKGKEPITVERLVKSVKAGAWIVSP